ncbi:MAG: PilN domain-containing protein [Actinomycetota bacterium]
MPTKQLVSLDTYVVPRINLLPPEIGQKRAERRSYVVMGIAVAGAVGAVAALYLGQASRVNSAKSGLRDAQTENTRLKADRASRQSVQDVYNQVDAQEALVTRALDHQVLWSVYMHDLSIRIPDNVWITTFTGTVTVASAPGTPVGTLAFTGKAYAYNDVAAWLESVSKLKGIDNALFTSASEVKPVTPKGRTLVVFTSTASLTPESVSPKKSGSK